MIKKSLLLTLLLAILAPWAAQAQETLTVYDETTGTLTSLSTVPMYGNYFDAYTKSEFVIPADQLSDMDGGTITSLKFYIQSVGTYGSGWSSNQQVFLKEVSSTSLSDFSGTDDATIVWEGSFTVPSSSDTEFEITFTTPYEYQGGNLLVGIYNITKGGYRNVAWYGQTVTGASGNGQNSSSLSGVSFSQRNFIPKTTFTYEAASTGCDMPTTIAVSDITHEGAVVTWEGDGDTWNLRYKASTDEDYTMVNGLTVTSYTLSTLNGNTAYSVGVQTVCSGSTSNFKSTSFTTMNPCAVPTNLQVSNITASSATLTWTAGYQETNWTVKYKKSSETEYLTETVTGTPTLSLTGLEGLTTYNVQVYNCENYVSANFTTAASFPYTQDFSASGIPTGWTQYTGLLEEVMAGTALTSTSYGWSNGTSNGVLDGNNIYANIYGSSCKKWIVTPAIPMESGARLTFDVAYTAYSGTAADPQQTGDDDKFVVLASTDNMATWTILRQWDNAGSEYVLNDLTPTTLSLVFDMAEYAGTSLNIAFYAESTVSNTDNNIHVDNVVFELVPACEKPLNLAVNYENGTTATVTWEGDATSYNIDVNGTVTEGVTTPYTLEGLELATTYAVMVQANCGEDLSEWTDAVSFNTDLCMPENQCELTFELTDSYGDGWNGAYIEVLDVATGASLGQMSNQNIAKAAETETYTLAVCDERELQFVWHSGSYDSEASYVVTDINEEVIFEGSGTMSEPVNYTVSCTVTDCRKPTDLAATEITAHTAVLSWTENGVGEEPVTEWVVAYMSNEIGYINGEGFDKDEDWTEVTATENPFNLTGLTAETEYTWKVRSAGCEDKWSDEATFTTDVACPAPANAQVTNISAYAATLSWTGSSESYNVEYRPAEIAKTGEWETVTTEDNTIALANLIPETLYEFRIQGNCGDEGNSEYTCGSFTTAEACPLPTNFQVSNVRGTSADLAWTGSIDVEDYTVQYRSPEHASEGSLYETFGTSLPTGWTMYNTLLNDDVLNGTTALTSSNYGWNFGTSNGVFDNHARMNVYGTYKYWLVTPATIVPAGAEFSFDLALTAYSGTLGAPGTTGTDDRFVVLVSTDEKATWSILRQWDNNDGSEYVYNNITCSATGEHVSFNFSAYTGQTVYVAFYGESTVNNADNNLHIDNVLIGQMIPASEWQTISTTETSVTLTDLESETPYEAQVKANCSEPEAWTTAITFTTLEVIYWNNPDDWTVPEAYADVTIPANTDVIIPASCSAFADTITIEEGGQIIIEDGGQLYHSNEIPVALQMNVDGYGRDNSGYYLIAAPAYTDDSEFTIPVDNTNLNTGAFDLYAFDQNYPGAEWRNFKAGEFDALTLGQGYLYANSEDINIVLNGQTKPTNADVSINLDYSADSVTFRGWNLVGNPFTCTAYVDHSFYTLNDTGSEVISVTDNTVEVMQGIFVVVEAEGDNVTFSTTAPESNAKLTLNLSQGRSTIDRAIVRFDEGRQLPKVQLNPNHTKVYIPMDGKDYAVVRSEEVGELPVSFKAETDGTYNLSFTTEEVSFNYLHLIDNMTGADVDLLETPSYTFEARSTDYANRFKLVFATGTLSVSENFAFFNNGNLLINNEGEATVQVIDINGRILSSETINGSASINMNGAAGVYMIRLINGENVRIQKVVVR